MLDVEDEIKEIGVEDIFLLHRAVHCGWVATDKRTAYVVIEINIYVFFLQLGLE